MMLWYTTLVIAMKLDVAVAPAFVEEEEMAGCLCAVIDVLRATSTIITALVSGAAAVYPCLDIAEARREAERCQGPCLLGGEDRGRHIPGFDLGNSPLEYRVKETVAGKVIVSYTSNGTGAIRKAYSACGLPVYIAALLNVAAVSSALTRAASADQAKGIVILCSGRYGRPSAEDLHCAGLIVENVAKGLREADIIPQLGDSATIAAGYATSNGDRSTEVLMKSEHGRFLESIGFAADLEFASRVDVYDAVPLFDGERVILSTGKP